MRVRHSSILWRDDDIDSFDGAALGTEHLPSSSPDDAVEISAVPFLHVPETVTIVRPFEREGADQSRSETANDVIYEEREVARREEAENGEVADLASFFSFEIISGRPLVWPPPARVARAERSEQGKTFRRLAIVARVVGELSDRAALVVANYPHSTDTIGVGRFKPGCHDSSRVAKGMAAALETDDPGRHIEEHFTCFPFATDSKWNVRRSARTAPREESEQLSARVEDGARAPQGTVSLPVRYAACIDVGHASGGVVTGRWSNDPRLLVAICEDPDECRRRLRDHPRAHRLRAALEAGTLFHDWNYPPQLRASSPPEVHEETRAGDVVERLLTGAIEIALAGPLCGAAWMPRGSHSHRSVIEAVEAIVLANAWDHSSRAGKTESRRRKDPSHQPPQAPTDSPPRAPRAGLDEILRMTDEFVATLDRENAAKRSTLVTIAANLIERGLARDEIDEVRRAVAIALALTRLDNPELTEQMRTALLDARMNWSDEAEEVDLIEEVLDRFPVRG